MKKIPAYRYLTPGFFWLSSCLALAVVFLQQATLAGPAPVALGSAATFGVLAGTTITNSGNTIIYGDLGLSPGGSLAGGPTCYGTTHLNDAAAAQAQADLAMAFADAAGRTNEAINITGDLGGQVLLPGLYNASADLLISSGDLLLDARGDASAVWIFQIGSTLTTAASRQIMLGGGARAMNIYWQVGTSATLGTASVFKGIILAGQSITLNPGATLEGKALAQNGMVTLDGNIVGEPPAPVFGPVSRSASGLVTLLITNTPQLELTLQTSTNLFNWTTVAILTPGVTPCVFTDSTAPDEVKRFYRAFYD